LPNAVRHVSSNAQVFCEGDRVLLRHVQHPDKVYLSAPLSAKKIVNSHFGTIMHSDIIGRRTRDIVAMNKGAEFRLTWPSLDEYITRVPRLVTPVYPLDAATIASLLDIHVDAGGNSSTPPLEIFEAGTGHGSLTLALARAVHVGNSHLKTPVDSDGEWKKRRGAVIHSLDISEKHSLHARTVVHGFRRGMYSPSVEFYVGDPTQWILQQIDGREGFLYAVLLDLPGPESHLQAAAMSLLSDGIVGVFCPSITQIAACVKAVKDLKLPLVLDRVVEFPGGSGVGAGLRTWDVRYARIRSRAVTRKLSVLEAENKDREGQESVQAEEKEYEMVCRPTSFERSVGGGFFGMFRRKA
ncbi:S-adenosyl-L-methionine-dependent methyltransferase, partial [Wilcoxina mikolae CBS 423.85]